MKRQNIDALKGRLRQEMRARLKRISKQEQGDFSASICEQIVALIEHEELHGGVIASFAAFGMEPLLFDLHQRLPMMQIAFPRCHGGGKMDFYRVSSISELHSGKYGILEPADDESSKVAASEISVYLVPALAYSDDGKRLGKGGGYYDRFFAREGANGMRVGVIFGCQRHQNIPTDEHDQPVDIVISEIPRGSGGSAIAAESSAGDNG